MTRMLVEEGYADVNGGRLYHEVAGQGHPLVLIHAGIADRRMWDPQFREFADFHRVIRYDVRGYGKTAMTAEPYARHEDLRALLDALRVDRVFLVGSSMGGGIAIDFALECPDRIDGLVLVASALGGYEYTDPDTLARWPEMEAAFEAGDYDRLVELEMGLWVAGPRRRLDQVDPTLVKRVRDMLRPTYPASQQGTVRRLEPPAIMRLEEIRAPTLVVVGDLDVPDVLRTSDVLARRIARGWKVVIQGVAHLPNMERPQEFNQVVLGYLDGIMDRPG